MCSKKSTVEALPRRIRLLIAEDRTIVLDGAVVKRHSLVGAGAVISPGKIVGESELWVGNPVRCVRRLSSDEIERIYYSARIYVQLKNNYLY